MKLITRDTDYAIRALCCIAGRKKRSSVTDLSKELEMPRPFLRKILQKLSREGFLSSFKGRGGGFTLSKPADKITIFEVMEVFQGDFVLTEHIFKGKICPQIKVCKLKSKLDRLEDDVAKRLDKITIGSII